MAKKDKGAKFIHMVSLNGARGEGNINDESIKVLDTINIPIQIVEELEVKKELNNFSTWE